MNDSEVLGADVTEVCACCGATAPLELDHIIPKAKGGKDVPRNFQLLCKPCNGSKGTGDSCQINHAGELGDITLSLDDKSSGTLEPFSTRLDAGLKALITQQAKVRGVRAGLIIEETMAKAAGDESLQLLRRIEKNLNSPQEPMRPLASLTEEPRLIHASPIMRAHPAGLMGSRGTRDDPYAYRQIPSVGTALDITTAVWTPPQARGFWATRSNSDLVRLTVLTVLSGLLVYASILLAFGD